MFLIRPPSARILALPVGLILIVSLIYYSSARVRSTAHKSFTPTPHHDAPEAPHDSTISPEHRKNAIVMAATMSDSVDWVTEELPQYAHDLTTVE
jgi:hypothetical protein